MTGLSSTAATELLSRFGPNALPERPPDPLWRRFLRQFASPLVSILVFALAFDLAHWLYEGAERWPIEASAIALILAFNAALGLYQEHRSEAALARLQALAGTHAWVVRDGQLIRVATDLLVPGDSVRPVVTMNGLFLRGLTYRVITKRFAVAWDTGAIAAVYVVAVSLAYLVRG